MEKLTRSDLMSLEDYAAVRADFRQKAMAHKRNRIVPVGEHVTLHFEDRLTMQYQLQEVLRAEKIFDAEEIEGELRTSVASSWRVLSGSRIARGSGSGIWSLSMQSPMRIWSATPKTKHRPSTICVFRSTTKWRQRRRPVLRSRSELIMKITPSASTRWLPISETPSPATSQLPE